MDIKILHSWLLEYLETDAPAEKIGEALALSGPSVEKVEKYGKNDWLYSIEVTTNRVDMMSVVGIAREAAVILPQFGFKASLKPLKISQRLSVPAKTLPLTVKTDPDLTNRVMAVVLDVKINETPVWMKTRLEAAGIRSLNLLIDITNYVMLETGHPTHVFDYNRIGTHTLAFRPSKKGEKLTTLDQKTYSLPGGDSVIDDGAGRLIDLPGIMGTANSVVTDETQQIVFFIDNNNPKLMRKTSMTLGIRTDAVTINEKNPSPELAEFAMYRGINLYQQLADAKLKTNVIDHYDTKQKTIKVSVSLQFIEDRLGVTLSKSKVNGWLEALGFVVKNEGETLSVTAPYWRDDISIPEDLVEEVARIYGYHNLPSILPTGKLPKPNPQKEQFDWEKKTKDALKYFGYFENYTYSLISKELLEKFGLFTQNHLKLKNPLSTDWEYLQTTLVPSLLLSLGQNQDKDPNLKIFEMANVYLQKRHDLPDEKLYLTMVGLGYDFFKMKGDIEALLDELGVATVDFVPSEEMEWLEKTIQANIVIQGKVVGTIGILKQELQQAFQISSPVIVSDINFEQLAPFASKNKVYKPIPKYPPVVEQMTFFNPNQIPAKDIVTTAATHHPLVYRVEIVDRFEEKISLEITYLNPKKSLSITEVAPIRKSLALAIEKLGLKLQGEIH